jgi:hypothetical protein
MKIVFAHFNSKIPKYLLLNLKRTIQLFPKHNVCLITDQDTSKIKVSNLLVSKYHPSNAWNELEKLIDHPKFFRRNFWFTSLARFIAISEFTKTYNEPILHIESDVIISEDFPFEIFSNLNTDFAFPVVNSQLAIASCLYLGGSGAAEKLINMTLESASQNNHTTDMYILKKLTEKNSIRFQLLPSSISSKEALDCASSEFLEETKQALLKFSGVFDGCDIGLYLFGEDPRNNRGFSQLRSRKYVNYLNVRNLIISIKDDREFPYLLDIVNKKQIPVFALHIHSKNITLFKLRGAKRLIAKSVKNSKKKPKTIFVLIKFFWTIKNSIRTRIVRLK